MEKRNKVQKTKAVIGLIASNGLNQFGEGWEEIADDCCKRFNDIPPIVKCVIAIAKNGQSFSARGEENVMEDKETEGSAVAGISLAQKLADIDARTKRIEEFLLGLSRAIARHPDGRTLIGVVGNIETKVNEL